MRVPSSPLRAMWHHMGPPHWASARKVMSHKEAKMVHSEYCSVRIDATAVYAWAIAEVLQVPHMPSFLPPLTSMHWHVL